MSENKNITATGRQWTAGQLALLEHDARLAEVEVGKGKGQRAYPSNVALAKALQVDFDTLNNWRKLPGYKEALRDMTMRVMREEEPEFLRKVMAVLLNPGLRGYDKVLKTYFQFIRPILEDANNQGLLDSVKANAALQIGSAQTKRMKATELFQQLLPEQRVTFLQMLELLDIIPAEPGQQEVLAPQVHYVAKLPTDKDCTTEEGDIVELEIGRLTGVQRRRKVSLYPIGDEGTDTDDDDSSD